MEALIPLILQYRYAVLFPLACVEGPLLAIVVGFLVSLGYFNPVLALLVLIAGDVVPDATYYYMGRFGKRSTLIERWGPKVGIGPNRWMVVERLWAEHPGKTMWVTKFAYGLSTPLLIFAGLVGVPARTFFLYSIPMSLLQYSVLMTLGYFFGSSYALLSGIFNSITMLVAAVVVVGAGYFAITFYIRRRFVEEEKKEEQEMTQEASQSNKG